MFNNLSINVGTVKDQLHDDFGVTLSGGAINCRLAYIISKIAANEPRLLGMSIALKYFT